MKISRVRFENFRNFRDYGEIECSTDGKFTIIYGLNGEGKTTLHQLFQWIFYNDVHFNKTTSNKLYNLIYEKDIEYGKDFPVWGSIDFIHAGEEYTLRREWIYKKELNSSKKVKEDLSLMKKDASNNWNAIEDPKSVIDEIIPMGLSEYFFFDGESMLAELRVKGQESANKLKRALYSIFDLDIYEEAVAHIGELGLKTTVLGKLFMDQTSQNNKETLKLKAQINDAQDRISILENEINDLLAEKEQKETFTREVSEWIGSNQDGEKYEIRRKDLIKNRDKELERAEKVKAQFGDFVIKNTPKLFASYAMDTANYKIDIENERNKLIPGINREFIDAMLEQEECICGRELCEAQYEHIRKFLKLLPPKSYSNMYDIHEKVLKEQRDEFNVEELETFIREELDCVEEAEKYDRDIKDIDEQKKNSDQEVEQLILDRQDAEEALKTLESQIAEKSGELAMYKRVLKVAMKKFEKEAAALEKNENVKLKIEIMQDVKEKFKELLDIKSGEYSEKLEDEIQLLLNSMLTTKRTVSVSKDFFVKVVDSTGDESKSEGQFAVVSFAYIGGIFKLLRSERSLEGKEYPLVLDGPFSKLDGIQRQNVIDVLPKYAPQIILFSKDNLQPYIDDDMIGYVWTLESNEEKNVASVKEGFLW